MFVHNNTRDQWAQSIEENARLQGFAGSSEMLQFAVDIFGVDCCQIVFCHLSDWLCWSKNAVLTNRDAQCTLVFKAALERAMNDDGIVRGVFNCSLEDLETHARRFNRVVSSRVYRSKLRGFLSWLQSAGFIGSYQPGQWQSRTPTRIADPNLPMLLHYASLTQRHIISLYGIDSLPVHRNLQTAKEWAAVWRGCTDHWRAFGSAADADVQPVSFTEEMSRRVYFCRCELDNWQQFTDTAARRTAKVLVHRIQWLQSRLAAFNQWRLAPH